MLINGLIINSVFSLFGHSFLQVFPLDPFSIQIRLDYLFFTNLVVILHEIIHLILFPNFKKSEITFFGIKVWGGFVFNKEKIGRNRYILISIAPYYHPVYFSATHNWSPEFTQWHICFPRVHQRIGFIHRSVELISNIFTSSE